jgi:hypothetical protein
MRRALRERGRHWGNGRVAERALTATDDGWFGMGKPQFAKGGHDPIAFISIAVFGCFYALPHTRPPDVDSLPRGLVEGPPPSNVNKSE